MKVLRLIKFLQSHESIFYFQQGQCLAFAVLVKQLFPESIICYDSITGHFAVEISINNYRCIYDIEGRIYDEYNFKSLTKIRQELGLKLFKKLISQSLRNENRYVKS